MWVQYAALAAVGGAMLPLQALINAWLGDRINGALWATACSFLIGTIGIIIILLLQRQTAPRIDQFTALPVWAWLGGALGAFYVAATILSVRPLGSAAMISIIIAAQIISSLVLEHFGILQRPSP